MKVKVRLGLRLRLGLFSCDGPGKQHYVYMKINSLLFNPRKKLY